MHKRSGHVVRLATPLKAWAQRFALLLFVSAAFGIMLLGKADTVLVERARMALADAVAPILNAVSEPVGTVRSTVVEIRRLGELRAENAALRREKARLMAWQTAARRLEQENEALRQLLHMVPDPRTSYVTARVVGDQGGSFVRSVLVAAGMQEGVQKGDAVLAGEGLAGRVEEVGGRSSRVLLVTDLNSRVPVVIEETRFRGVLAGDNSDQPKLLYLPPDVTPEAGQRIVTSGHGGAFPPGLPVGVVSRVGEAAVRVQPFVDFTRMEHLRIVDYGMSGILAAGPDALDSAADTLARLAPARSSLGSGPAVTDERRPRDPLDVLPIVAVQVEAQATASGADVFVPLPPRLPASVLEGAARPQ